MFYSKNANMYHDKYNYKLVRFHLISTKCIEAKKSETEIFDTFFRTQIDEKTLYFKANA